VTSAVFEETDRRRPARGDQRRSALLAALDELLKEKKLEAISVSDITGLAGVTRPAFYFYFENKPMAVAALMSAMYDDAFTATDVLVNADADPRQRIAATIQTLIDSMLRHESLFVAMLDARHTSTAVREMWETDRASFVAPVAALIDTERAAGVAPGGTDSTALATVLLELNDRALERIALGSPLDVPTFVEALTTIWFNTIYGSTS
jgi:AcrR family transcriptional regulator